MGRETDVIAQSTFENTRIIDIAPLYGADDTKRAQVDRAIAQAMEQHGSFVATGHPQASGFGVQMQRLLSFFTMGEDKSGSVRSRTMSATTPTSIAASIRCPKSRTGRIMKSSTSDLSRP
jgi:isopenicillin N synthase-like dioxygenase